jgi:hypothetical protein
MIHLDPGTIDAILDGSLDPAQARALREHLAQPCERCEAALTEHSLDLEGLLRLVEAHEAMDGPVEQPLSPLERAALWQSIESDMPATGAAPRRRPAWRLPAGAAVAVLAMAAALLIFLRPPQPYDGIKGPGDGDTSPAPPSLELRVVLGREVDGTVELERRVQQGEVLARDAFLLFELEADRLAARYLFVVDAEGAVTQLAPAPGAVPALQPAGSQRVGAEGGWVVLDLADMQGLITVVAAASSLPVDTTSEVVRPWQAQQPRDWVAYDILKLEVAP